MLRTSSGDRPDTGPGGGSPGLLAGHHPRGHVGPWHPPWQAGLGHLGRRFGGGWRRGLGHRRRRARRLVDGRLGRPRHGGGAPGPGAARARLGRAGSAPRPPAPAGRPALAAARPAAVVVVAAGRPAARWGGRTRRRRHRRRALALTLGQRAGVGGLADEPVGAGRLEDRGGVAGPVRRRLVQPRLGRPLRRWQLGPAGGRPGRGGRLGRHHLRHLGPDEHAVGQQGQRRHPAVPGVAELDLDAVALAEAADHVQPQHPREGEVDLGRVGQPLVGQDQLLVAHPQAAVLDLDDIAVRDRLPGDLDPGVGRRERGRVLDQLGQQVDHVDGDVPGHLQVGQREQLDPLVLLDLGGGRPDHVDHGHRLHPVPARVGAREHDQVLGVAAHAGRQVVEPEQVLQGLGVGLVALQVVDQLQLAVDQGLGAAGQVGEHVADRPAQAGLLGGQPDRDLLDVVHRLGDLADLVLGVDADRLHPDVEVAPIGGPQPLDRVGQPLLGDLDGPGPQLLQGPGHRPGHQQQGQQGDAEDEGDQQGVAERVALGGGAEVAALANDALEQPGLDAPQQLHVGRAGVQPLVGRRCPPRTGGGGCPAGSGRPGAPAGP